MFSTKCASCRQIAILKPDEVQAAIAETEAAKHAFYSLACPRCRKAIKVPLKDLKASLPKVAAQPSQE